MMRNLAWLGLIVIGGVIGFGVGNWGDNGGNSQPNCPADSANYELLNPFVECNEPVVEKYEYTVFRDNLEAYVEGQKRAGTVQSVAVYFRDLNLGPTFGLSDRSGFVPASLLKIPLLITYLRLEDEGEKVLDKQIIFEGKKETTNIIDQYYKPSATISVGKAYKISELLEKMVIYSDNDAYDALFSYLAQTYAGENLLLSTYRELGIIYPQNTLENSITVKAYASIFRLLYNASFLSPELSEKALELLSRSEFREGIVKGVPESVRVAHKFGERQEGDTGMRQFHDCGIVYYPRNPYILCVMTKGKAFEPLVKVIAEISRMVYEEVSERQR